MMMIMMILYVSYCDCQSLLIAALFSNTVSTGMSSVVLGGIGCLDYDSTIHG